MGDLSRGDTCGVFKKVKVRSLLPVKFKRTDKERMFSLTLEKPPEMTFMFSEGKPKPQLESRDIKDLKAAEKRIFEVENCNISAIANDSKEDTDKLKAKEHQGGNPFDIGSSLLGDTGVFDISNNQMF